LALIYQGFQDFAEAFRGFRALNNSPALGAVADRLEGGEFVRDASPGLGDPDGNDLEALLASGTIGLRVVKP
jgi:hypothetical protein